MVASFGRKHGWEIPKAAVGGLKAGWPLGVTGKGCSSSADGSGNDVMRKEISAVLEECIDKVCSFA